LPEALNEETPDVAPVPGDGHRGKAALLLEVGLIPLPQCCQWRLIHRRRWRGNGVLLAQVLQEVAKGWRVNLPNAAFASEFLQEAVDDWLMQIDKCQVVPDKPSFEVDQEL
jgi:hypothetical protein